VGKDEQELQSPSWFNVHEAKLVLRYVNVSTMVDAQHWAPTAFTGQQSVH
jgi:hypothetical protein